MMECWIIILEWVSSLSSSFTGITNLLIELAITSPLTRLYTLGSWWCMINHWLSTKLFSKSSFEMLDAFHLRIGVEQLVSQWLISFCWCEKAYRQLMLKIDENEWSILSCWTDGTTLNTKPCQLAWRNGYCHRVLLVRAKGRTNTRSWWSDYSCFDWWSLGMSRVDIWTDNGIYSDQE